MYCDVCSKYISSDEIQKVAGGTVLTATRSGFVPSRVVMNSIMVGVHELMHGTKNIPSKKDIWHISVNNFKDSEWGFCQECYEEYFSFEYGEKTSEKCKCCGSFRRKKFEIVEGKKKEIVKCRNCSYHDSENLVWAAGLFAPVFIFFLAVSLNRGSIFASSFIFLLVLVLFYYGITSINEVLDKYKPQEECPGCGYLKNLHKSCAMCGFTGLYYQTILFLSTALLIESCFLLFDNRNDYSRTLLFFTFSTYGVWFLNVIKNDIIITKRLKLEPNNIYWLGNFSSSDIRSDIPLLSTFLLMPFGSVCLFWLPFIIFLGWNAFMPYQGWSIGIFLTMLLSCVLIFILIFNRKLLILKTKCDCCGQLKPQYKSCAHCGITGTDVKFALFFCAAFFGESLVIQKIKFIIPDDLQLYDSYVLLFLFLFFIFTGAWIWTNYKDSKIKAKYNETEKSDDNAKPNDQLYRTNDWIIKEVTHQALAKIIVNSDDSAAAVLTPQSQPTAGTKIFVKGIATCHGCGEDIPFELKFYWGLGMGGGGRFMCPKCGNQLESAQRSEDVNGTESLLFYISPWTSQEGQRMRPIEMTISSVNEERGQLLH